MHIVACADITPSDYSTDSLDLGIDSALEILWMA